MSQPAQPARSGAEDPLRWVAELEMLGMRLGLQRMRRVLSALGHPERRPAIHVVGTNGKSSTTRMAAAILAEEGVRAGAYTSPHVTDWTERVTIDALPVRADDLRAALADVRLVAEGLPADDPITQFEALTAAALLCFARQGTEAIVVEAGLGGRYDATNVLTDPVVVLTNVALEHTDLLGETEAEIAAEKLAVAPDGHARTVVGRLEGPALRAVVAELSRRGIDAWREGVELTTRSTERGLAVRSPLGATAEFTLPSPAGFVRDNALAAVAAVERFLGRPPRAEALDAAFRRASLPGRLERLRVPDGATILLDGAHNPAGMRALVEVVPEVFGEVPPVAVVSVLGDKDAGAMMAALSGACRRVVTTRSSHRRTAEPESLAERARAAGMDAEPVSDPSDAVVRARALAEPGGGVLVCGSLYLLADVRPDLVAGDSRTPATLARADGRAAGTP